MSDVLHKIISKDPFCRVPERLLQKSAKKLKRSVACDSIAVSCEQLPFFVDCGDALEQIFCPQCGRELSFAWWGEAMDKAAEEAFASLLTETPCCGTGVSLHELDYRAPCGFSCWQIELLNPASEVEASVLQALQERLGTELRVIKAHI